MPIKYWVNVQHPLISICQWGPCWVLTLRCILTAYISHHCLHGDPPPLAQSLPLPPYPQPTITPHPKSTLATESPWQPTLPSIFICHGLWDNPAVPQHDARGCLTHHYDNSPQPHTGLRQIWQQQQPYCIMSKQLWHHHDGHSSLLPHHTAHQKTTHMRISDRNIIQSAPISLTLLICLLKVDGKGWNILPLRQSRWSDVKKHYSLGLPLSPYTYFYPLDYISITLPLLSSHMTLWRSGCMSSFTTIQKPYTIPDKDTGGQFIGSLLPTNSTPCAPS